MGNDFNRREQEFNGQMESSDTVAVWPLWKFWKDRKPHLTSVATENKPTLRSTKKGDDLRSAHIFTWLVTESGKTVDV